MIRPPRPMMLNNIPWNYLQPNFHGPNPRAINRRHNFFNPRMPTSYNEGGDHWCETCDRGFATVIQLERHKQQHQKCNIDGCQFVAHPKMITKHIQMQHSSGLYKRIAKLDNPEEIKKWREERKKNFPTKSNIEKKAAELNEKNKRGEKMGLKYDKGIRKDKHERNFKSGTKRKYDKQNFMNKNKAAFPQTKKTQNNNRPPPKKIPKVLDHIEESRKLKPFAGIRNIIMNDKDEDEINLPNDNILIEDDDSDNASSFKTQEPLNIKEPSVCTALNSLMCNYGSSDEDETETDSSIVNKVIANIVNSQPDNHKVVVNMNDNKANENDTSETKALPENSQAKEADDDDSGPEETTIVKESVDIINDNQNKADLKYAQKKSNDKIKRGHKNNTFERPKLKSPSTLLQKLLFKEIRHERNIILQCVRYVIKNNYFDED